MSAEGMPQEEPSLLARPLRSLTRLVLRFPVPVLVVGVAAALVSAGLTYSRLGFHTSRLDLLNPESGYNRLWVDYINEFGDEDDVVVVVEGGSRECVVPVLEEISTALARQDRLFHAVLHEVDLSKIRSKGLHYLQVRELVGIEQFLEKVGPIIGGEWGRLNLGHMTGGMTARLAAGEGPQGDMLRAGAQQELSRLSDSLLMALDGRGRYQSPWPEMPCSISTLSELSSEYLLTNEGRLGFVLLRLARDGGEGFVQNTEGIDTLRRLIAQVQARHPDVQIGLTGLPVMQNDEMRSSQASMTEASLLSLVGVACLFIAGFGGLRHPLMTMLTLLVAMAWSFGYITLAVGHLNILSISFGVILIGLGIDFGVHYVARYLQLRGTIRSPETALVETASGVGPGVVTGAITTAIAFFVAGLTEFTGVAELGLIAGGGIILCCLAGMTFLPAMIHLADRRRPGAVLPAPLDVFGWLRPVFARSGLLIGVTLVYTLTVSVGMARIWYDHNLLNLQPEGLESVELERKLLTESDQSVWFALSIAESSRELLERKRKFEMLPSVQRTEEIASLFPSDDDRKRPVIEQIHRRLENLPERPPRIPVDSPYDLGVALAQAQALVSPDPRGGRVERQIEQVREALRQMPLDECYSRLSDYQQRMAGDLLSRLHILRSIADPEPPQLSDLPEGLVTRFVGQRGRYLLKIYSKGNIWDMDAMERFVKEVRSVDPRATGNPLQTYEASRAMKRSYEQAAWYALVGIVIALLIDFGRFPAWIPAMAPLGLGVLQMFGRLPWGMPELPYWIYVASGLALLLLFDAWGFCATLLAMLPLGLGMVQMFGILGWLDIPLNPANMIVLPLILGIGIDNGVHVVHDFRRQRGPYRMSPSTASAVVITSLTSMVGFGSLMIASHRGLQSLGRVLTIGISCCLFASLLMLPALLTLLTRHRTEQEAEPDQIEPARAAGTPHLRRTPRRVGTDHPGTSPHATALRAARPQPAEQHPHGE
jgi:hopanoid biosynthesis associated RND transporter like protein HpnN